MRIHVKRGMLALLLLAAVSVAPLDAQSQSRPRSSAAAEQARPLRAPRRLVCAVFPSLVEIGTGLLLGHAMDIQSTTNQPDDFESTISAIERGEPSLMLGIVQILKREPEIAEVAVMDGSVSAMHMRTIVDGRLDSADFRVCVR